MRNFRWSHTMHDAARRGSAWLAICALFLASGCGRSNQSPGGKEFTVRGIVRGLSPDRTTVDIQHEAIPGYMPSMTMPFAVREPRDAADLRLGDTISFRLVVNDKEAVINHVTKIPQREIQLPSIASEAPAGGSTGVRLREGDALPEFSLTSETSQKITRDTFQGKPLLLTFIFTRCPVATFCPRMSKNFSELQEAIKNTSGASAGTRLLSITIDPGFDTPPSWRSTRNRKWPTQTSGASPLASHAILTI